MQTAAVITFVYSMLVLLGGVMGFVKARSVPSVVSAAVCSLLADAGAVMMLMGRSAGVYLAMVVSAALVLWAGNSWLRQGKPFMPRGLLFVLSAGELLLVAITGLR
jgi:uncharacterized membrane protein (UPF0136 family)